VLKALAGLPLSWLHALGTVLGWTLYGISPTYRRHLKANLALAGYTDPHTRRAAIAAAGDLAASAGRGRRTGTRSGRHGGRAGGARSGQGAAFPHAAHGVLRGRGTVRVQARADHRALSRAEDTLARSADARGTRPRRRAAGAGRLCRRARAVRRVEARRGG